MLCQWIYKWIFLYPFENFCENFMPQNAAEHMTYVAPRQQRGEKKTEKKQFCL